MDRQMDLTQYMTQNEMGHEELGNQCNWSPTVNLTAKQGRN